MKEIKKPESWNEDMREFLDELREFGDTNMFGASQDLADEFLVSKKEARECLGYWMKTFEEYKDEI